MWKYGLPAAFLIAVAVAVMVWFSRPPEVSRSPELERVATLMAIAERTCLSGRKLSGGAKVDAAVSKLKAGGSAGVSHEEVRGAVDTINEELKSKENESIRNCMRPYTDEIFKLVIGSTSGRPPQLRVSFWLEPDPPGAGPPGPLYLGERYGIPIEVFLAPDPDKGYYTWQTQFPTAERPFDATVHRKVSDGTNIATSRDRRVKLCLVERKPSPPPNPNHMALLKCRESEETCNTFDEMDPRWVDFCPASPPRAQSRWLPIAQAFAQGTTAEERHWVVPALKTLRDRADQERASGVAYTEFSIETVDPLPATPDAEAVWLALKVNGVDALIDGVEAPYRAFAAKPGTRLTVSFGLQNLGFSGASGGCEVLEATLTFVKYGKPVAEPFHLKRTYVALRDAEEVTMAVRSRAFRWTGVYRSPAAKFDNEVFVGSILFPSDGKAGAMEQARLEAVQRKRSIDDLQLTFDSRKVVGVVRPPLRESAFGVALGLVEPSGQIRFILTRAEATRLRSEAVAQAKQRGRSEVIRPDTFVYQMKGSGTAPRGVCAAVL